MTFWRTWDMKSLQLKANRNMGCSIYRLGPKSRRLVALGMSTRKNIGTMPTTDLEQEKRKYTADTVRERGNNLIIRHEEKGMIGWRNTLKRCIS